MKILLFVYALWSSMYIDISDGNFVELKFGTCKKDDNRTAEFSCAGKCRIKLAFATFTKGGQVKIIGRYGKPDHPIVNCNKKTCYCKGSTRFPKLAYCNETNESVNNKNRTVYYFLRCKEDTKNLRMIVDGNVCYCKDKGMTGECDGRGGCICKYGHKGGHCELCSDWYFKDGNGFCQICHCANKGMTGNCYGPGLCVCKAGHSGSHCDQCIDGYFEDGNGLCQICNCNGKGMTGNCGSGGVCICKPGHTGCRCDQCNVGYHKDVNGLCQILPGRPLQ